MNENSWHSCGNWPLESHFTGRPCARALFDRLAALASRRGPITVVSSKTRVTLMTRVRFAGVTARKDGLRIGLWLTRAVDVDESPYLVRVSEWGPSSFGNAFVVRSESELESLARLIDEARAVGDQLHEHQRRRYRATP